MVCKPRKAVTNNQLPQTSHRGWFGDPRTQFFSTGLSWMDSVDYWNLAALNGQVIGLGKPRSSTRTCQHSWCLTKALGNNHAFTAHGLPAIKRMAGGWDSMSEPSGCIGKREWGGLIRFVLSQPIAPLFKPIGSRENVSRDSRAPPEV